MRTSCDQASRYTAERRLSVNVITSPLKAVESMGRNKCIPGTGERRTSVTDSRLTAPFFILRPTAIVSVSECTLILRRGPALLYPFQNHTINLPLMLGVRRGRGLVVAARPVETEGTIGVELPDEGVAGGSNGNARTCQ